eukprot:scaffold30086_cov30-Cyclotella_meneghiniana.AAC.1
MYGSVEVEDGVPTSRPACLENLPEAYRSIAYFGSTNCEESQLAGSLAWRIFPKLTARSLILDRPTARSPN